MMQMKKILKDVFSSFGVVLSTKIMRDTESGKSKKYGFVSFDNFDSSDAAINSMNGQFLGGKIVDVSYAYKKDTKGERHGSAAERILAANRPNAIYNSMFPSNNNNTNNNINNNSNNSLFSMNNFNNLNNIMKPNNNYNNNFGMNNNMNQNIKFPNLPKNINGNNLQSK